MTELYVSTNTKGLPSWADILKTTGIDWGGNTSTSTGIDWGGNPTTTNGTLTITKPPTFSHDSDFFYEYWKEHVVDCFKPTRRDISDIIRKELGIVPHNNCNNMLPIVEKVETYNNRVVKVTFGDGSFTKSVCGADDVFDLDVGITICLIKKMLGPEGHKAYNNWIRDIHKKMEENERKKEERLKAKAEMRRKKRKAELKKAAKELKKRQEQIDIHKTAIIEASRVIQERSGDDLR